MVDSRYPLDTRLKNREEICAFCRQDWRVIYRLIVEERFPAIKDGKNWTSDMVMICDWNRKRLVERG